jgi:hypothetical protein
VEGSHCLTKYTLCPSTGSQPIFIATFPQKIPGDEGHHNRNKHISILINNQAPITDDEENSG